MSEEPYCKFCGSPIKVERFLKLIGEKRTYSCGKCGSYCKQKCDLSRNAILSWHKEPCVSCSFNPYAARYSWDGQKWVKKEDDAIAKG